MKTCPLTCEYYVPADSTCLPETEWAPSRTKVISSGGCIRFRRPERRCRRLYEWKLMCVEQAWEDLYKSKKKDGTDVGI